MMGVERETWRRFLRSRERGVAHVKITGLFRTRRPSGGTCILGPTAAGRVILENFRANGRRVDCFVDPQGKFRGESWAGLPVVKLAGQEDLPRLKGLGIRHFSLVAGATAARKRLFEACLAAGLEPVSLTHPTATILAEAVIGRGCVVGARAIIGVGAELGDDCLVGMATLIDHDCRIGPHTAIGAGVTIGAQTVIEEGGFIGDGVTLLPSLTIGAKAIIVSGSVVTQDLSADAVSAGVPARLIRRTRR